MPKAVSGVSIEKAWFSWSKNWRDGFPFANLEELELGLEKWLMHTLKERIRGKSHWCSKTLDHIWC